MSAATSTHAESLGLPSSAIARMTAINLLWGGAAVSAANALQAFGPFTLATLRFLPAGLLLLWFARRKEGALSLPRSDWPAFLALGFFGIFLTYSIFYFGVYRTTASDASLLIACEPLLIALAARIFLGERLNGRQWIGLLFGLAGIYLITGRALGNLIALIGLCCECGVSVVAKRLAMKYPGLFVVAVEMLIGSALLLPFAIGEMTRRFPAPDVSAWMGYLYLAVICSMVCYGLWFRLMERYPVSAMGVFILLQPLVGPFYGWLLRGETLKPGSAVGGGMVIAGIVLTTLTNGKLVSGDPA